MDKKELRRQIREAKKLVPLEEKLRRSAPIMNQVEQLPQFQQASTVLLYWSMDDEVQTHSFVERWYRQKVRRPCCCPAWWATTWCCAATRAPNA